MVRGCERAGERAFFACDIDFNYSGFTVDCRLLDTSILQPARSHGPIRFMLTSLPANLIGPCDLVAEASVKQPASHCTQSCRQASECTLSILQDSLKPLLRNTLFSSCPTPQRSKGLLAQTRDGTDRSITLNTFHNSRILPSYSQQPLT